MWAVADGGVGDLDVEEKEHRTEDQPRVLNTPPGTGPRVYDVVRISGTWEAAVRRIGHVCECRSQKCTIISVHTPINRAVSCLSGTPGHQATTPHLPPMFGIVLVQTDTGDRTLTKVFLH